MSELTWLEQYLDGWDNIKSDRGHGIHRYGIRASLAEYHLLPEYWRMINLAKYLVEKFHWMKLNQMWESFDLYVSTIHRYSRSRGQMTKG